jgi:hypothetical protein
MNKPLTLARAASTAVAVCALAFSSAVLAKLPPPSDDAKAKAAEAAAKTAHAGKVGDYQLCQSMDKVAARYLAAKKKAGGDVTPPTPTPPCADPGPFVYPPPAAGAPAVATVAAAAAGAAAAAKKPGADPSVPKK